MQWALRGGRPSVSERKCPGSLRGPVWPWPQPGSGETCPVQCSLCTHPLKLLRPHLTRRLPAQTPAQTAPALTPAPFLRDLRQGPHPGLGNGQLGRISRSPASCWSARNSCSVTVPTRSRAPGHPRCSDRVEGAQCGCEWPAPWSPEGIPGQEGGSPPPPHPAEWVPAHTWEKRPQPKGAPGRGDASDDAVEQEADLLTLGRGQEEDPSPCGEARPGQPGQSTGGLQGGLRATGRGRPQKPEQTRELSPHPGSVPRAPPGPCPGGSGHTAAPQAQGQQPGQSRLQGSNRAAEEVLPAGPGQPTL